MISEFLELAVMHSNGSVATLRDAWANCVRPSVQAVGVIDPAMSGHGLAEGCEEDASILVVSEDPLTRIVESSNSSCEATAKLLRVSSR